MQYIEIIKKSFLFFPLIAFFITIPFIISNYHKYGAIHKLRTFIIYSFVLYLLTIYFLVIMPLPSMEEVSQMTGPVMNILPFSFIFDFIKENPLVLSDSSTYLLALKHSTVYVVLFNVFMTIPFGMYLKYYFRCSFKKTLCYSFFLSFFFEFTQLSGLYFIYPRAYRLFDVDDLLLNTLGGCLGYFIMLLLAKYLPSREKIDEETRVLSRVVSPLRRLTACFIDSFCFFLLTLFLKVILRIDARVIVVSFIIYYLIFPLIFNDATLGNQFLHVKKEYAQKPIIIGIIYSIFKSFYYLAFPYIIFILLVYLKGVFKNIFLELICFFFGILFVFSFYWFHLVCLFKNGKSYYDDIFKVKYVSTKKWE